MANPPIIFSQLSSDEVNAVASFHSARGATVVVTPDGTGKFTVQVTYPGTAPGPGPDGASGSGPPSTGGTSWQQLVNAYKSYRGASDSLKVATLAQWILESGRGTSALATQQLNFGGMKYRDRMAGFATPFTFTGSDGEATAYCKFTSLDAFIDGYWHFIQTGPYTGWQRFNNDAAGFISFIAPNYAADPQYATKVTNLVGEASNLLGVQFTGPGPNTGTGLVTPGQPTWTELRATFLNRRSSPIQGIVLHDTAGAGTHNDTLYLQNPQDGRMVSVDFTVERDGSIFKLNPDLQSFYCNHAGRATEWMGFKNKQVNAVSIGIEIVQFERLRPPPYYPAAQVQAVGRLCAWLGSQFNFNNSRITTHRNIITDGSRSDPRMFPFEDFWAAYWSALGRGTSFQNSMAGSAADDDATARDFATTSDEF